MRLFTAVDGKCFKRLVEKAGFPGQPAVSRNGPGTKLFLTGRMTDGTTLVEIVSQEGVELKRFTSGRPIVNDAGKLVAGVTNYATTSATGVVKSLAFATGEEIPIVFKNASPATFEFSPGVEFFLLSQSRNSAGIPLTWASAVHPVEFLTAGATNMGGYQPAWQGVFRTSVPMKPLFRLPNDFYARAIFTREYLPPGMAPCPRFSKSIRQTKKPAHYERAFEFLRAIYFLSPSGCVSGAEVSAATGSSTNSRMAILATSPRRSPSFTMRV